jgi:hypothetical protein
MPTDIYLIRKNQSFAKYKQAEEVSLTSSESYSMAVTGTNTNDLIYPPAGVPVPAAGSLVYFSSVTGGGTAIAASRMYYVINTTATTFQLAVLPGSSTAVVLTSDITAGVLVVLADDEIKVWSSEYRDTFATQGSVDGGVQSTFPIASQFSVPGIGSGDASTDITYVTGIASGATATFTPTVSVMSDEAAHAPLRQTLLKRTHWKIDMGATLTPRYLYACWQDGDTWASTPPDTK